MAVNDVSTFLEAYIILKLGDIGVDNPDNLGLHSRYLRTLCPDHRTLKLVAETNSTAYSDLIESLKDLHISKSTVFGAFVFLTETLNIEHGEIYWWKILTLIHCSAQLAVMCVDRELPNMVEKIFLWTSSFLERDHVQAWIEDNGGWELLLTGMETM